MTPWLLRLHQLVCRHTWERFALALLNEGRRCGRCGAEQARAILPDGMPVGPWRGLRRWR